MRFEQCPKSVNMELPVATYVNIELRAVTRFLFVRGEKAATIHRQLVETYGEGCVDESTVRRWVQAFREGRTNLADEHRIGRPRDSVTNENIERVRELLCEDARFTLDELAYRMPTDCSRTSISRIIHDELQYRKVSARWVPRLLTNDHKSKRLAAALRFKEMLEREGDDLFARIVTGDETWLHHFTPESKQQSMHWCAPGETPRKKAKVTLSVGKVMGTVFWDQQGILLCEYMPKGTTINSASYQKTLTKLRAAIWRKRPGLTKKMLLLHDNARPHSAAATQDLLAKFQWEVFAHPPYSPDLAPSDYHLFPQLKRHLGGMRFTNDADLQKEVSKFFAERTPAFWKMGISKLRDRYSKCQDRAGDYVEK